MDLLQHIETSIEFQIDDLQGRITKAKKAKETLRKLGRLLQHEVENESVTAIPSKFRIDFKNQKRAREIVRLLIEKTEIEEFSKTMEESWSKVVWHYKAKLDGIAILIGPAPPNKKCKPVNKPIEWPSWECEMK